MKMNILKSKKDFLTRKSSGCFSFDEIVTFYTQTQNFLYVIEHYTTDKVTVLLIKLFIQQVAKCTIQFFS